MRPTSNNVRPKSENSLEVFCAHGLLDLRTHKTAALRSWKDSMVIRLIMTYLHARDARASLLLETVSEGQRAMRKGRQHHDITVILTVLLSQ